MVPPDRPEWFRQRLRRPWRAAGSLVVGLTLGGMGCGSSDFRGSETPSGQLDSAGVRVVESLGPQHAEVTIERPVVLVAAYDTVPFSRIAGVVGTAEGGFAVADNGPEVVWLFSRDGTPRGRFGGRGGGPGEFDRMIGLHGCEAGERIAVVTPFAIHLFTLAGEFDARLPYRTGGEQVVVVGISSDCSEILLQERVTIPPVGEIGVTEDRLMWRGSEDIEGGREVARAQLLEAWIRGLRGEVRPFLLPWGTSRSTVAITGRGGIVLGHGRRASLHIMGPTGKLETVVRWRASPEPVTYGDRLRYERDRRAWRATVRDDPEVDLLFPPLSAFPRVFEQKPIFDRVLAGPDETIWVRSFPDVSYGLFDSRLPERPRVAEKWSVISAEGPWLYDLTFPTAFELRDVGADRLFGIVVDSLGVQRAAAVVRPVVSPG